MAHVDTTRPRDEIRHVYLHGTTVLRAGSAGATPEYVAAAAAKDLIAQGAERILDEVGAG